MSVAASGKKSEHNFPPSGCTVVIAVGSRPVRKERRVGLQKRNT